MTGLYAQHLFSAATFFNTNQVLAVSLRHSRTLPNRKSISDFKITHAYLSFDRRGKANIKGHTLTFKTKPDRGYTFEETTVVIGYDNKFSVSVNRKAQGHSTPERSEITDTAELKKWKKFIDDLLQDWNTKKMQITEVLPASDHAIIKQS